MKFSKSVMMMACAGLFFVSCKESASSNVESATAEAKTEAPVGKLETASFNIEGMTCAMGCAKTIEKKLAGMDGVQKATVDFDKKTATVEYDNAKQTPETLAKTVESAADGKTYKVSDVKSSGDHAMLIDKDKKKKNKKNKKGAATDAKAEEKSGCCSAKKACHGEEKA